MGELDDENIWALDQIRDAGRVIILATKRIEEQREIRREAKEEFKALLKAYPQAREVYYYDELE